MSCNWMGFSLAFKVDKMIIRSPSAIINTEALGLSPDLYSFYNVPYAAEQNLWHSAHLIAFMPCSCSE